MAVVAERTETVQDRLRKAGVREDIAALVPDPRCPEVQKRIAEAVAGLDPAHEAEAMAWIEAVADFGPDWK